jgi:phage terminase Nu1 subunit (DNA packaging protein)
MEDVKGIQLTGNHGGRRPGAGRKKKEEQHDDHARYVRARADLEQEKARLAELERMQLEGELIPAGEVERRFEDMAARVKAKMLSIPGKVAPQLIAVSDLGEADAIIKKAIHEALEELKP